MTRFDVLTPDGLHQLRRARDEFLAGGLHGPTPPGLPGELAAAWRRALFYGVVPDLPAVPRVMGARHSSLLTAARPVLERLDDSLSAADLAVVLSDARGRVEAVQAQSHDVRRHLERIDTGPGADLSETTTGLNGISAVVETGRPALVRGPQHVLGLYQETACAGVPIRDPLDHRLRGVLSLVCGLEVHPVLLSTLADTAAAAIERELLHHTEPRERVLLDAFLPERARTPAVLTLDGRTRIISDLAASLLVDPDLAVLEDVAATAVRDDRLGDAQVLLPGSGQVARLREVLRGGVVAGVLVTLDRPDLPRPRIGAAEPPPASNPAALPGLVGRSPAWLALLRRVEQAAGSRVLVVVGEWGTGRGALARAVGVLQGRRVVELDAADTLTDPLGHWTADLARALADDALAVVRGADTLPAPRVAAVRTLLHRSVRGAVALTGRLEDERPWHRDLLPVGRAEVVEVPPLRDRRADVADLVAVLSAPHLPDGDGLRLALDAEAAMRRWAWPGNVEELGELVSRLCAEVGDRRPVTSVDLPEEMRRVTRTFTGLEQAERTAIRAALRASAGNRSRAADALGIGRTTLYRKLRRYGLDGH